MASRYTLAFAKRPSGGIRYIIVYGFVARNGQ